MRTHFLALAWVLAACGSTTTQVDKVPEVSGELASGQTGPTSSLQGLSPEETARMTEAALETDRRYSYYGGVPLAVRRQTGSVDLGHPLQFAMPARAGRCHRVAFAAERPGISLSLQAGTLRQGPLHGTSASLGQYRTICPARSVMYRMEITTSSATPIAFGVIQTEVAR